MLWGTNKFFRRIFRPHSVPNNELLDLLSRVPDDEMLVSPRTQKPPLVTTSVVSVGSWYINFHNRCRLGSTNPYHHITHSYTYFWHCTDVGEANGSRTVYAFRSYDSISVVLPVGLQRSQNYTGPGTGPAAGRKKEAQDLLVASRFIEEEVVSKKQRGYFADLVRIRVPWRHFEIVYVWKEVCCFLSCQTEFLVVFIKIEENFKQQILRYPISYVVAVIAWL